jgi:thiamine monophosphate synthase
MEDGDFLLAVITSPGNVPREVEYMEGLLAAGLEKLHLRKPEGEIDGLLEHLAPRWASRLVIHGNVKLAEEYGVTQVHVPPKTGNGDLAAAAVSTSVHSWAELKWLPKGLAYAFISPVFDSISKPGYPANPSLLKMPVGPYPCRPVGLGGVSADTIGMMVAHGWRGAAVLGWILEEPRQAVRRYEQLKKIVDG